MFRITQFRSNLQIRRNNYGLKSCIYLKYDGYPEKDEVQQLVNELENIINLHQKGAFTIQVSQEDCHTAIEDHLVEKLTG
ncbi:hypothetical protein JYT44_02605 [Caldithrix abyssi]|nr:hypothetical protein [Caldithrix abyssi]